MARFNSPLSHFYRTLRTQSTRDPWICTLNLSYAPAAENARKIMARFRMYAPPALRSAGSEFGLLETKNDRPFHCAQIISSFRSCSLQIGQFVQFLRLRFTHHAASTLLIGRRKWPNSAQSDHSTDIRILNSINPHSRDAAMPQ